MQLTVLPPKNQPLMPYPSLLSKKLLYHPYRILCCPLRFLSEGNDGSS